MRQIKFRILFLAVISMAFLFGGCLSNKKTAVTYGDNLPAAGTINKSNVGYVEASKIDLLYARALQENSGTTIENYVEGYIEVEKPSYDRTVTIHYAMDNDLVNWYDDTASITYFAESPNGAPGTREILYFKKKINQKITFALKYARPGYRDYWDNNYGKDFSLGYAANTPDIVIKNYNVVLEKFAAITNSVKYKRALFGTIVLKNIAYVKDVKVVYSTDNWNTSESITANYGTGYYDNMEKWNFDGYLDLSVNSAKFKIEYNVNGNQYVDDNFGNFYTANW